jgi:APA family basic amino acid/polyamine antiporter
MTPFPQLVIYIGMSLTLFTVLSVASLFVFRRRERGRTGTSGYRALGHPYTTALFVLSCAGIVGTTIVAYPENSLIGMFILLSGIPVYWYWSRRSRTAPTPR